MFHYEMVFYFTFYLVIFNHLSPFYSFIDGVRGGGASYHSQRLKFLIYDFKNKIFFFQNHGGQTTLYRLSSGHPNFQTALEQLAFMKDTVTKIYMMPLSIKRDK